ncbi:MAG: tetratricopeptide repeat protein [Burkholderiales bacterium]|nr:tetratricopeptide repeat protein [Burkholderiales bacterium]
MKKSLLTILWLSASLFLIGCADDQARQQIADTNQKMNQLQQNVAVLDTKLTNQKVLDLLNQIDGLQTQINQLNGRVANLEQGQKSGSGDINQQIQALDMRLSALENPTSAKSNANAVTDKEVGAAVAGSDSTAMLQSSIAKIKSNDLAGAIAGLKQVAASNDKQSAVSARYYLSVAYVANNQYSDAVTEANKFIALAGNKNKNIPDAMRVVYIAQVQLGQEDKAKATANKLLKLYPSSEAAKKVAKQIQK